MIPKIIWQTHEWEYNDLPVNFKRCVQTWKNLNPDWEHIYHSAIDRAIAVKNFDKEIYQYYMFADKVTQSDIWRYVVIYENGGFYTDMDSFCTAPLSYLFNKDYGNKDLFCTTDIYNQKTIDELGNFKIIKHINNSSFAAVPRSKILKDIIDFITKTYKKYNVLDLYNAIEKKSKNFCRYPAEELWLGAHVFSSMVFLNKEKVCFEYDGSIHSNSLKQDFKSDFSVNYYGIEKSYMDLCKEHKWKDFI
jgi:hypothetical protein